MLNFSKTSKTIIILALTLMGAISDRAQFSWNDFALAEESKGKSSSGASTSKGTSPPAQELEAPSKVLENQVQQKTNTETLPSPAKSAETEQKSTITDTTPKLVQLMALLTEDGQTIDKGLIWRVYTDEGTQKPISEAIITDRTPSPTVRLKPGIYSINVAFGRANLTRRIVVASELNTSPVIEKFVINAGGLKVNALLSGKSAPNGSVSYSIYTDRDQSDERRLIVGGVKTGVVMRLNAGIYFIESIYGDANATIRSDVTVEAGKLTEVVISHSFAKISFKLVTRSGGDALPNTQWSIQTPEGIVVKESIGALPSHTLAPGSYTVIARNQDRAFKKDFSVKDGQNQEIEILLQ